MCTNHTPKATCIVNVWGGGGGEGGAADSTFQIVFCEYEGLTTHGDPEHTQQGSHVKHTPHVRLQGLWLKSKTKATRLPGQAA